MHQHFHAFGAAFGEEISAVRLRRTLHGDHPGQRDFCTGEHVSPNTETWMSLPQSDSH